jgi:hypothetical protein
MTAWSLPSFEGTDLSQVVAAFAARETLNCLNAGTRWR